VDPGPFPAGGPDLLVRVPPGGEDAAQFPLWEFPDDRRERLSDLPDILRCHQFMAVPDGMHSQLVKDGVIAAFPPIEVIQWVGCERPTSEGSVQIQGAGERNGLIVRGGARESGWVEHRSSLHFVMGLIYR
jgi:hypothetical protein